VAYEPPPTHPDFSSPRGDGGGSGTAQCPKQPNRLWWVTSLPGQVSVGMSDTLVEQVHGYADVKRQGSGDIVVPNARYNLRVWQEYKRIRTLTGADHVPGLKRVDGTIEAPMNSELYIDLPDGRRLNFFVSDMHGSVARMPGSTFP
jgi:hypothetical protein